MRRLAIVLALITLPLFAAEKPVPPADLTNPPTDAERLADGLVTKTLVAGSGTEKLTDDYIARVRYTVWKSDGTLVQHVPSTQSLMIAPAKMLPGWAEAAKMMVVGETRRAWIPSSLGGGKIKDGEAFVIDTELLELIAPPVTPDDVAAPPADAQKTPSGLAYKVLRPGTGTEHPKKSSWVTVNYSGWTTDGKMFDSSIVRGQIAEFRLTEVIPGWTEGMQLMVEGEKTRFWIPQRLAYKGDKSKPQGMLVFDIDLIRIR